MSKTVHCHQSSSCREEYVLQGQCKTSYQKTAWISIIHRDIQNSQKRADGWKDRWVPQGEIKRGSGRKSSHVEGWGFWERSEHPSLQLPGSCLWFAVALPGHLGDRIPPLCPLLPLELFLVHRVPERLLNRGSRVLTYTVIETPQAGWQTSAFIYHFYPKQDTLLYGCPSCNWMQRLFRRAEFTSHPAD